MRLLFELTCASIVFCSTAFAQTDLDQLRQAYKEAENESTTVCASAKQQVDSYRRDHGDDSRKATTPQQAGQMINDINAYIAELQKSCANTKPKATEAFRNLIAGYAALSQERQRAKSGDSIRSAH